MRPLHLLLLTVVLTASLVVQARQSALLDGSESRLRRQSGSLGKYGSMGSKFALCVTSAFYNDDTAGGKGKLISKCPSTVPCDSITIVPQGGMGMGHNWEEG